MGLTEGAYQENINYNQFLPTISYSKIVIILILDILRAMNANTTAVWIGISCGLVNE
jgi:hypothetical protein